MKSKTDESKAESFIVDKAYKETLFKNSIKRAIYKSSPLPSMPDGMEFNEEIICLESPLENNKY